MEKIVLYSRVSTLDQDFESQFEDLKRWAKSKDFDVVKTFGEKISGYDVEKERVEYESMKKYVLDNNIKHIAVWEISRLSRSIVRLRNEIDFFTSHKVNIHFKKEGLESISDNSTNTLLITVIGAMSEMEGKLFKERGARGRMSGVMKGHMIGYSNPPYGYTSDENKVIKIDKKEAKVIKMMYDMAIQGYSLYAICQHLNSLKIPTRESTKGKKRKLANGNEIEILWKPNTIARNIKRSLYKGVRVYKGISISVPAIVSENVWDQAQERFKENIGYLNRTKHNYLFKGKMKCGKCGRSLVTYHLKNTKWSYYLCTAINDQGIKCNNGRYINTKMIDTNLYALLFQHHFMKINVSRDQDVNAEIESKRKQIEFYKDENEKLKNEQKKVVEMYEKGYRSLEDFTKRAKEIKEKITQNESSILNIEAEISTYSSIDVNEIISNYKNTNNEALKREFVMKYVNKVLVYKINTTDIQFKKPLYKNEKIIYIEVLAFNYFIPMKIVLTPNSKNVFISQNIQYLPKYDHLVDLELKK